MLCRHAAICVFVVVAVALSMPTQATTLTVTNGADVGVGSLRATLAAAHDGDIIKFQPNVTTVNLTSGELVIDKAVTIIGKSFYHTTIQRDSSAATHFRVLHVGPGVSASNRMHVVLQNLRISGGDQASNAGGAILIDEHTDLTLTDSLLTGNHAETYGGAIDVTSTAHLSMSRCTLSSNSADSWGGAIAIPYGGSAQIDASTFDTNTALDQGGGILAQSWEGDVDGNPANVSLTVVNSTFTGNSAPISTSTIEMVRTGNRTTGTFTDGQPVNFIATLRNLTISGNTGPAAIVAAANPGPGTLQVALDGSIVVDANDSLYGINISGSDNLFSDAPTLTSGSNNQTNTDPILPPLGNYAGPTQTMAPIAGSPAINAMPCANAEPVDQRGLIRPEPGNTSANACDIGAVELGSIYDKIFKDGFE